MHYSQDDVPVTKEQNQDCVDRPDVFTLTWRKRKNLFGHHIVGIVQEKQPLGILMEPRSNAVNDLLL